MTTSMSPVPTTTDDNTLPPSTTAGVKTSPGENAASNGGAIAAGVIPAIVFVVLLLVVALQTSRTPDDVVDGIGNASWVAGVDRVETDESAAPQERIPALVGEVFVRKRRLFVGCASFGGVKS